MKAEKKMFIVTSSPNSYIFFISEDVTGHKTCSKASKSKPKKKNILVLDSDDEEQEKEEQDASLPRVSCSSPVTVVDNDATTLRRPSLGSLSDLSLVEDPVEGVPSSRDAYVNSGRELDDPLPPTQPVENASSPTKMSKGELRL